MLHIDVYHFARVDQREKQGYKSDVSLKAGIRILANNTLDLNL